MTYWRFFVYYLPLMETYYGPTTTVTRFNPIWSGTNPLHHVPGQYEDTGSGFQVSLLDTPRVKWLNSDPEIACNIVKLSFYFNQ